MGSRSFFPAFGGGGGGNTLGQPPTFNLHLPCILDFKVVVSALVIVRPVAVQLLCLCRIILQMLLVCFLFYIFENVLLGLLFLEVMLCYCISYYFGIARFHILLFVLL